MMKRYFWLASYPKSGNTWLRLFLESLSHEGATPDINAMAFSGGHAAVRDEFERLLDIESNDLTDEEITRARPRMYELEAQAANAPLLRKVHDAWELTPAGEPLFPIELTLGAIYLVRDPRDVAVSLAHHMRQSLDQTIERMSNPQAMMSMSKRFIPKQLPQRLTSWSGHVESWLEAPVGRLLLKYEDMLSDPEAHFGAAVRFLGIDADRDKIAAAVEAVAFERLRSEEKARGFVETPPGVEGFFRRGIAGGWRESLTPAQVTRIETDHAAVMRSLNYL
ncbi:MAG: sulfotransferase domain-containing protein [Methylomonas sp.]|nr:sulfotransferase domain-containing protein [Methylomonas sp.]